MIAKYVKYNLTVRKGQGHSLFGISAKNYRHSLKKHRSVVWFVILQKKTAEAVFQTSGDNCNAVKAVSTRAIVRAPHFPCISPKEQRENPKIINNNYA